MSRDLGLDLFFWVFTLFSQESSLVSPKDIAFISTSEIRAFHARELNATGPSTGVNELRILSNRNLPRVAMRINHHLSVPFPCTVESRTWAPLSGNGRVPPNR